MPDAFSDADLTAVFIPLNLESRITLTANGRGQQNCRAAID